jgi:hypothetical protein
LFLIFISFWFHFDSVCSFLTFSCLRLLLFFDSTGTLAKHPSLKAEMVARGVPALVAAMTSSRLDQEGAKNIKRLKEKLG